MKTAQELADELYVASTWRDDAHQTMAKSAEMLLQQAEQIEALTKMLVISDDTHQTWMKENSPGGWIDDLRKENESLKADAERYRKLKSSEGPVYAYAKDGPDDHGWFPAFGGALDEAIDAMKGQE